MSFFTPCFKAKIECNTSMCARISFTHKVINSEINSITNVYYIKSYNKNLLKNQEA
jgi:hypothetical protein